MQLAAVSDAVAAMVTRRGVAVRYGAVSVFNLGCHQFLLNLANSGWGWSGGWSNVFAAVLTAIPGYLFSRHWVWGVKGPHSFRQEIVPFWTLALMGLIISTALAELADRLFGSGVWVAMGSLIGYFVVWLSKFIILDRMFHHSATRVKQQLSAP